MTNEEAIKKSEDIRDKNLSRLLKEYPDAKVAILELSKDKKAYVVQTVSEKALLTELMQEGGEDVEKILCLFLEWFQNKRMMDTSRDMSTGLGCDRGYMIKKINNMSKCFEFIEKKLI